MFACTALKGHSMPAQGNALGTKAFGFLLHQVQHRLDHPGWREHLTMVGNALFGFDKAHRERASVSERLNENELSDGVSLCLLFSHHPVNLCCKDKIAFHQPINFVGPDGDHHAAPRKVDVGVVALLLGKRANAVGERQRFGKIGEGELLPQVVLVHDFPVATKPFMDQFQIIPSQRRNAPFARDAILLEQRRVKVHGGMKNVDDDWQIANATTLAKWGERAMGNAECRMPNVECRMLNAECRMSNAECRMPNAECQMSNAECRMPKGTSERSRGDSVAPLILRRSAA